MRRICKPRHSSWRFSRTVFSNSCWAQRATISSSLSQKLAQIEKRVQEDPGDRGIGPLISAGELESACLALHPCQRVLIITGFPCMLKYAPPTETDGPLGAYAIAQALLATGKKVVMATDVCNQRVLEAGLKSSGLLSRSGFDFRSFSPPDQKASSSNLSSYFQEIEDLGKSVDAAVAIERAGPSPSGKYCTMRAFDMTKIIAPLERAFLQAPITVGIGDGGNEVGMGKVLEKVKNSKIPRAEEIVCVTPAQHLLVSSVSNWGGYALAAGLAIVSHQNEATTTAASLTEVISRCVPSAKEERERLRAIVDAGARDGISGEMKYFVDGMDGEESIKVLEDIISIALKKI